MTQDRRHRSKLKEFAVVASGTALGAAVGHTAVQAARRTRYGKGFRNLPPGSRLEYLVPAATGLGIGAFLANHMKQKARKRNMEKRSYVLAHVYRSIT